MRSLALEGEGGGSGRKNYSRLLFLILTLKLNPTRGGGVKRTTEQNGAHAAALRKPPPRERERQKGGGGGAASGEASGGAGARRKAKRTLRFKTEPRATRSAERGAAARGRHAPQRGKPSRGAGERATRRMSARSRNSGEIAMGERAQKSHGVMAFLAATQREAAAPAESEHTIDIFEPCTSSAVAKK